MKSGQLQINELRNILNEHFHWHKTRLDCFVSMLLELLAVNTVNLTQCKRDLNPIYLFRPAIVNLFLVDMPWQQLFDLFQGLRPGQFFKNMT